MTININFKNPILQKHFSWLMPNLEKELPEDKRTKQKVHEFFLQTAMSLSTTNDFEIENEDFKSLGLLKDRVVQVMPEDERKPVQSESSFDRIAHSIMSIIESFIKFFAGSSKTA